MVVTGNNTVLVTTEARPGQGGDYDFNDILMRRSTDGGITFGPVIKIVDHTLYGDGPVGNFVMIPGVTPGHVVAVFCHDYARAFCMHSHDDGITFSEPINITTVFEGYRNDYPWQVIATGPGHGTRLRNGRMIIPIWMSDGSGSEIGKHRGHRPSVVSVIYSDDHGHTWQRGDMVCRHGDTVDNDTVVNPSETLAVELSDGSVMLNIRSESATHRRLIAVSPDGVSGWRYRGFDQALLEPVCMGSLLRSKWPVASEPGCLIFANPDNLERTMTTRSYDRKRLTVKMSMDDGKTWPMSEVLEPGPSGYSDLAQLADGTLLCLYECDNHYLRLARINKK